MRIGIVTYWNSEYNYGQVLQSYALQRFLNDKGHDSFVIRYVPSKGRRTIKWYLQVPWKIIRRILFVVFNHKDWQLEQSFKKQRKVIELENSIHPRHFSSFKEKYIAYSSEMYDQDSLYAAPPEADIYVAGSDQIWSGIDPCLFLQFVPQGKGCISYAPSFGGLKLTEKRKKILKCYLDRFSVLTVREQDGIDICRQVGRDDAEWVLDPTLLLSREHYERLLKKPADDKDYVLLYLLGNETNLDIAQVYARADKLGLEVKYVPSQGQQDRYDKIYPSIEEWIGLIAGARYVVTNSFHGVVFSVIMNKSFWAVPLVGTFARMNRRIYDLLRFLELEHCVYDGVFDESQRKEIDYARVNGILERKRNELSQKFDKWFH